MLLLAKPVGFVSSREASVLPCGCFCLPWAGLAAPQLLAAARAHITVWSWEVTSWKPLGGSLPLCKSREWRI